MSKRLHCKDLLFTQYDCPQTDRKQRFFIECNMIVYVIHGRRVFHKDKMTWELDEGVCAFIKKGTHISEKEGNDKWCVMAFFMPDHFLKQLITENQKQLPLAQLPEAGVDHVLLLEISELSKSFFQSMLPYFSEAPPPPENLVELKFKELILSLLAQRQNRRFLSYLFNLANDKHPSLEEILERNYTINLNLTDYAKLACKSVPTFKREFKRVFNDSPAKWVLKKRLSLATELLGNTTLNIGEVCFECGFENQTHFSRIFKDHYGVSPLKFRTNLSIS